MSPSWPTPCGPREAAHKTVSVTSPIVPLAVQGTGQQMVHMRVRKEKVVRAVHDRKNRASLVEDRPREVPCPSAQAKKHHVLRSPGFGLHKSQLSEVAPSFGWAKHQTVAFWVQEADLCPMPNSVSTDSLGIRGARHRWRCEPVLVAQGWADLVETPLVDPFWNVEVGRVSIESCVRDCNHGDRASTFVSRMHGSNQLWREETKLMGLRRHSDV